MPLITKDKTKYQDLLRVCALKTFKRTKVKFYPNVSRVSYTIILFIYLYYLFIYLNGLPCNV